MSKKQQSKIKKVFDTQKSVPKDVIGRWRSIEFECIFNNQQQLDEFIKYVEESGYDQFITIQNDGSITKRLTENVTKEIVVSFCAGKAKETQDKYPRTKIVWDVCKFLKDRAYVNPSCGTHVHFDMRGFKREQVEKFGARLACAVPALKKILPKSRRDNHHCHDIINSIDGAGDNYDFGYSDDRYAFVNMQAYKKYQTIEIRGHAGTLNARKILNWIKICEKIMVCKKPKDKTYFYSPLELCEYYKFNEDIAKYIKERYNDLNAPREIPIAPEQEKEVEVENN